MSISSTPGVVQSALTQTDRGNAAPVRFSRPEQPETWNGQALRQDLPLLNVVSLATDAPLDSPALDGVFADQLWSTDDAPTGALTAIGASSDESALALLAVLVGSYSVAPTSEPDRRSRKLLPG
jgi:hypothetical protein